VEAFKRRTQAFVLECLREADASGRLQGAAGPHEGMVLVVGAILALAHAGTAVEVEGGLEVLAQRVWSALNAMLTGAGRGRESSGRKQ
jgi:hypothetical protein